MDGSGDSLKKSVGLLETEVAEIRKN